MNGTMTTAGCKVYASIAAVMSDLASTGIAKDQKNQAQGYRFRGIDAVYNALASVLSARGIVILPRVTSKEVMERTSSRGGTMLHVSVDVEYDIVSTEDGSKHTVKTAGEAMDSGDKATNKALSAAYKYMAFQTFCIPTEGEENNDADFGSPTLGAAKYPEDKLNAALSNIQTAESWAKLKNVFGSCYKTIRDVNDQDALGKLTEAYNESKKRFPESVSERR